MLCSKVLQNIQSRNNFIAKTARIYENVKIGENNYIGENVVLYPGVEIGNNNYFYPNNVIGEVPVSSNDHHKPYDLQRGKGVSIGNNNLFHVSNIIFSGLENKTTIGNHNKFLAENHMGHDAVVKNFVTFYPRVIQGGHSVYLDHANVGMGSVVQQRKVVGQFSMLGGCNMYAKDVFPFFVSIGSKITRLNLHRLPPNFLQYEAVLKEEYEKFLNKDYSINDQLRDDIKDILRSFYAHIRSSS